MQSDYVIITDSTTDLPQTVAEELGLVIVPYIFTVDGQEYLNYLDNRALSSSDFYAMLRSGKTASTSLVTEQRYLDIFEPYLADGKDIIYLCLSSGLSGSYSQSILAADALKEKYPDRKMVMLDSLTACLGQGLLAYYAGKARLAGRAFEDVAKYLEEMIPRTDLWLRADDLHHLKRGGRISSTSAVMGTMLDIKPLIHVNDEGQLIPIDKVRGKTKSLKYLVERLSARQAGDPDHDMVFVAHSDAMEDAIAVASMVKERFGPREVMINDVGPVIGAHTGPGSVIITYLATNRDVF